MGGGDKFEQTKRKITYVVLENPSGHSHGTNMRDNEYGRVVHVYNNGRTVGAIRSFPAPDHG